MIKGTKHSEESLRKMSLVHLGRVPSKETIEKRKSTRKGYRHSEETKRKIREALNKEEVKEKLRQINSGSNHPQYGRTKSILVREKLRLANLGKKQSNETVKKRQESRSWYKSHSEETRNKISQSNIGKKMSEEQKKKLSKIFLGRPNPKNAGPNHFNWRGGTSREPYGPEFSIAFKNRIRIRDNQVCMNCGIHREKMKIALAVHHVNYDKLLSIPENCISLCASCHTYTNHNREYWKKLFQDKMCKLYGYQYEIDGNIKLTLEESNKKYT